MNIIKLLKLLYAIPSSKIQNVFRSRFQTDNYIMQSQIVSKTHSETFGEYKNKYCGQELAIIATGPSLKLYKPIEKTINIGVNKAILNNKVSLDYYFAQDYSAVGPYLENITDSKFKTTIKFYGELPKNYYGLKEMSLQNSIIPESVRIRHCAKKYYTYTRWPYHPLNFNPNIETCWLADGATVIISAMQFALYTNPKRIYLVGCDCSNGYFDSKQEKVKINKRFLKSWLELKTFADIYYPETEIVSVNPVGLKGIFTDLYQE